MFPLLASQGNASDILPPNSVRNDRRRPTPSPGDWTLRLQLDKFVPSSELPMSATLDQLPQASFSSTTICAEDLVNTSDSIEWLREPLASDEVQPQSAEHDGAKADPINHRQHLNGDCFGYCEFTTLAYGEQAMIESRAVASQAVAAQGAATTTAVSLPSASNDVCGSSGQLSDATFTNYDFATKETPFCMSSNTKMSQLDTNASHDQSSFARDESDAAYNRVFESDLAWATVDESIPALTDSRPPTPCSPADAGTDISRGALFCPHPSCVFRAAFVRQCDYNKHCRLHFRKYPCRFPNCQLGNGRQPIFALRKDRDRHESAHKPSIRCLYCGGRFSRRDNLRDHCRSQHGGEISENRAVL